MPRPRNYRLCNCHGALVAFLPGFAEAEGSKPYVCPSTGAQLDRTQTHVEGEDERAAQEIDRRPDLFA